jgi:hypothetical protein
MAIFNSKLLVYQRVISIDDINPIASDDLSLLRCYGMICTNIVWTPRVNRVCRFKSGFRAPQICKKMYHKIAISMGQQDNQWEFQDPKIGLKKMNGRYLQSIGSCCMAIDIRRLIEFNILRPLIIYQFQDPHIGCCFLLSHSH